MTFDLDALTKDEKRFVLARSYPLFAAYYFGYTMAPFHSDVIDHWNSNRYSLSLLPAQHTKSTSAKIYIIQQMCLNPNVRIILTTAKAPDAEEYVRAIESELTGNKKLIEDFGPFYNPERWTNSGFRLIGCQHNDAHDTLETFGSGTWNQKGHGCDIVICDDVVTEESCLTEDARRKQNRWFYQAVHSGPRAMWNTDDRYGLEVPKGIDWPKDAAYNPKTGDKDYGQVIVLGTRFNPKDLYFDLEHDPSFKTLHLDCWTDKEETKPLWPAQFTNEKLHALRRSYGVLNFNKRFRNIAMDDSEITFKLAYFTGEGDHPGCFDTDRSYGELPTDEQGEEIELYKVLGFDPASGEVSKYAAYPTWMLMGFPTGGDPGTDCRYLIDAYRAQVGPEYQIDILFDGNSNIPHPGFYAKYAYDLCKIERNGFANLLISHHRVKEAQNRGVRVESAFTHRDKRDPVTGVQSMESIFREGLVRFPYKTKKDKELTDEIVEQFVYFSFDRSGRRKSLTDYVMADWFCEIAFRKASNNLKAYKHPTSRWSVHNPAYSRATVRNPSA